MKNNDDIRLAEILEVLLSIDSTLKKNLEINSITKAPIDDCTGCYCADCEDRKICKEKQDTVLGIKGSPCNDCCPGQRYKPKEKPKCTNFKLKRGL